MLEDVDQVVLGDTISIDLEAVEARPSHVYPLVGHFTVLQVVLNGLRVHRDDEVLEFFFGDHTVSCSIAPLKSFCKNVSEGIAGGLALIFVGHA